MPEEEQEIELLEGSKVKVRFIWRFAAIGGPAYYPQAIRAWPADRAEQLRLPYEKSEWLFADQLAAMIQISPAYIFTPRSRLPFARAYLEACKLRHPEAMDISKRFCKVNTDVVAGENDTTADDVYSSLAYDAAGDEASIKSIMMVDDVVAAQKTTIATLSHLVEAGMPLEADITVASLLRIKSLRTNS